MTSSPKDKKPTTTLNDSDITSNRAETRRTFLKRSGIAGLAAFGVASCAPGAVVLVPGAPRTVSSDPYGGGSDTDPNDPYGGGSDTDPSDPYGGGTDSD